MGKIKVLHINLIDVGGGSAAVAFDLVHASWQFTEHKMLVKYKRSSSSVVDTITYPWWSFLPNFLDKIFFKLFRKTFRSAFFLHNKAYHSYRMIAATAWYQECDIIHLHNMHGEYLDLEVIKPWAKEKLVIWTMHDMWALTGGEAHTLDNINYQNGIAWTPYAHKAPLNKPWIDRRQAHMNRKKILYADAGSRLMLVPCAQWLEAAWHKSYVYNDKVAVRLIRNPINLERFRPQDARNWTKPKVLFINHPGNPFKGSRRVSDQWDEALRTIADWIVIGKDLPGSALYLPDVKGKEAMAALFNQCDVLVFPSEAETFPLTVLEAMACGVYVIGSDIAGLKEPLAEGRGLCIDFFEEGKLLKSLAYVASELMKIRSDGTLRRHWVQEHCSEPIIIKAYEEAYLHLLSSHSKQ